MANVFFCIFWVTGELSTLRPMMKVPNEPGLSPNNGLENAFLSNQFTASQIISRCSLCRPKGLSI